MKNKFLDDKTIETMKESKYLLIVGVNDNDTYFSTIRAKDNNVLQRDVLMDLAEVLLNEIHDEPPSLTSQLLRGLVLACKTLNIGNNENKRTTIN